MKDCRGFPNLRIFAAFTALYLLFQRFSYCFCGRCRSDLSCCIARPSSEHRFSALSTVLPVALLLAASFPHLLYAEAGIIDQSQAYEKVSLDSKCCQHQGKELGLIEVSEKPDFSSENLLKTRFVLEPDGKGLSDPVLHDVIGAQPSEKAAISDALVRWQVEKAYSTLMAHYVDRPNDPNFIQGELRSMAIYIGQRQAAFDLLDAMRGQAWKLQYRKGMHKTVVRGSAINVKSVRLYFDPRAAAQVTFHRGCAMDSAACTISPVDALLHELLHAYTSLLETDSFIRSGAMSSLFYPVAHERDVIERENQLYRAMSDSDHIVRPVRREHSGQYRAVHCATCRQPVLSSQPVLSNNPLAWRATQ